MTSVKDVRRAHDLLDHLDLLMVLSKEQEKLLRSFLPELPAQKTLEEITEHVYDAWVGTEQSEWPDDVYGDLETWLAELRIQLQGLVQALSEETWEYAAQARRGGNWETCINSETHLEEWWESKDDAEYEVRRLQEQGRKTRIVCRRVSPPKVCE